MDFLVAQKHKFPFQSHRCTNEQRINRIENGNETLFISSVHSVINMHFTSWIVYGNVHVMHDARAFFKSLLIVFHRQYISYNVAFSMPLPHCVRCCSTVKNTVCRVQRERNYKSIKIVYEYAFALRPKLQSWRINIILE